MPVITRFAPSPTGLLHVGNIRTALINWLYSKSNLGKFILRIDDTDHERSKVEYVDAIKRDMEWLNINWDAIFFQSQRMERYELAKNKLIDDNRLYPCYETTEELAFKKKILLSRNLPPIYDRSALKLTREQINSFQAQNIKPHWRFLLKDEEIRWNDGIRGDISFLASNLSDPVLFRADGTMTYTLASVVDDIDFGITDIIRGEDHISNSATHIQIFESLKAIPPKFAHLSLISVKNQEISKRVGGFDIERLRNKGIESMAINSFLAKLGTSDPIQYRFTLEELINEFSLTKFSKAIANYDIAEVERINTKLIHNMPYNQIKNKLDDIGMQDCNMEFWEVIKHNLNTLQDVKIWWQICHVKLKPTIIDLTFTKQISNLLPQGKWDIHTWDKWISDVKSTTKRTGKDLFVPIRLALTGQEHGPELKYLLPLLGSTKTYARLNGELA